MMRSGWVSVSVAFGLLMGGLFCGSAIAEKTTKIENNIRAELVTNPERAILSVRFLRPLREKLSEITFTVNGRPLKSQWFSFPAKGQISEVVALLDVGDPARAVQIRDGKEMMLLLGATRKEHQHFVFGSYAATPNLFSPANGDSRELVSMIAMAAPLAEPSNLSAALLSTIISLGQTKGDRRVVLVFTDGHNDSAVGWDRVEAVAQAADVAISFILSSSSRGVDISVLTQVAARTGGNVVAAENSDNFLREPLATIETGGTALAPLRDQRQFFWENTTEVVASIAHGPRKLELAAPVTLPNADFVETVSFLAQDTKVRLVVLGSLAGLAGLVGLAVFLRRYRRKHGLDEAVHPQRSGPPLLGESAPANGLTRVTVILKTEEGIAYPLQTPVAHIGRSTDNEVIISDPAVSRLHAIMRCKESGQYSIENRSSNGTFVNNKPIDVADLVEGDLITIGSVTLKYFPV